MQVSIIYRLSFSFFSFGFGLILFVARTMPLLHSSLPHLQDPIWRCVEQRQGGPPILVHPRKELI